MMLHLLHKGQSSLFARHYSGLVECVVAIPLMSSTAKLASISVSVSQIIYLPEDVGITALSGEHLDELAHDVQFGFPLSHFYVGVLELLLNLLERSRKGIASRIGMAD